ncbi:MAG: serine hydrolase domain-containing protein [Bacteroidota bacterium]
MKLLNSLFRLGLCMGALAPVSAHAQNVHPRVESLCAELLERTQVAGFSIAVMQAGELVHAQGFGHAQIKQGVLMEATTPIRTGSVAKVITATALGRLATEGKLDFDAPLGQYLPYLQEPFASLTTRQVAGHTAGIPHRPATNRPGSRHYADAKENLVFFQNLELLFAPNSQYQYSTLGYNLLGMLIQEISGKPYTDYLQQDVFQPLGMTQTYPDRGADMAPSDAHLYYLDKGKLKWDRRALDGSYKLAGAGFRSTSVDLVKMMLGYQNGFISEAVRKDMFASGHLTNGDATQVGIGWRLNRDPLDRPTIEHAGSWQGARTVVLHYPEEDLSIAIMINTQCTLFIEETAHLIAQVFFGESVANQSVRQGSQPLVVQNRGYDGTVSTHSGTLNWGAENHAVLSLDMDSEWLKQNPVFELGTPHDYALATPYGLLYLQWDASQQPLGKVYQYQLLGDPFHMRQAPCLELTAAP